MKPRFGVVCTSTRDAQVGRRTTNADSYLIAADSRVSWLDGASERFVPGSGRGSLLAVADGDGPDVESARAASTATCRVLAKLWQEAAPPDRVDALGRFLVEAHTRMSRKARERGPKSGGASVAVAWVDGERLVWARIGTAQILLFRDGELRPIPTRDAPEVRFLGPEMLELVEGRDVGVSTLRGGDQVVLVTDGFLRAVDPASATQILLHVDDPQTAAVALMERALARGAVDGVTVLIADLRVGAAEWKRLRTVPGPNASGLGLAPTAVSDPTEPPPAVRREVPPVRTSRVNWREVVSTDPG